MFIVETDKIIKERDKETQRLEQEKKDVTDVPQTNPEFRR